MIKSQRAAGRLTRVIIRIGASLPSQSPSHPLNLFEPRPASLGNLFQPSLQVSLPLRLRQPIELAAGTIRASIGESKSSFSTGSVSASRDAAGPDRLWLAIARPRPGPVSLTTLLPEASRTEPP